MSIVEELNLTGVAQVIVVLKQEKQASAATQLTAAARSLSPVASAATPKTAAAVESKTVTSLATHFSSSEHSMDSAIALSASRYTGKRDSAALKTRSRKDPVRYYPNLGIMLGTATKAGLKALKNDSHVDDVLSAPQLMHIRPQHVAAAKLSTKITHGIRDLKVPKLWSQGLDGQGVLVGHLDTGVDGSHAALKNANKSFAEFDFLGNQVMPSPPPTDSDDHGTHTAGTIAGRPVSGRHIGVAPAADLASATVIEGGNVVARVLGGMDWAVGQGVRILNMSLGFPGYVASFLQLTQLLRIRGILPVFAVGNEGPGTSRSPGNYVEALSVGAVDKDQQMAWFSSSHEFQRLKDPIVPDLVGPGVDIVSAKPGGGYQLMNGTSMATPHIAGLAALLFQAEPAATVDQVEQAIFGSCNPNGIPVDRGNRGFPDATVALNLLTGGAVPGTSSKSAKKKSTKKKKTKKKSTKKKSTRKKTTKKKTGKKKTTKKKTKRSKKGSSRKSTKRKKSKRAPKKKK